MAKVSQKFTKMEVAEALLFYAEHVKKMRVPSKESMQGMTIDFISGGRDGAILEIKYEPEPNEGEAQ